MSSLLDGAASKHAPEQQLFPIQIPSTVVPGGRFAIMIYGNRYELTCPTNKRGGDTHTFSIALATKKGSVLSTSDTSPRGEEKSTPGGEQKKGEQKATLSSMQPFDVAGKNKDLKSQYI